MEEERSFNHSESFKDLDVSSNVVTIQELQRRRQELLQKKQQIIDKMHFNDPYSLQNLSEQNKNVPTKIADGDSFAEADTLTTLLTLPISNPSPTILENVGMDFSSDDSAQDPTYVPLSEITNLQHIGSTENVEWFPERDMEPEVAKQSRSRKRKADIKNWKRETNKRNRMLGKEYMGYRKVNAKYIQSAPKSRRVIGPKCDSPFCNRSKIMFCSQLTEEMRQDVFDKFWSQTWAEKKMYVSSMVDKKDIQRKTTESASRRSNTKVYYLQVEGRKVRVCLTTFLNTLGIKEWTVRYWLGDGRREELANDHSTNNASLENTGSQSKRDSVTSFLMNLPKLPSHYCRKSSTKQYLEPIIQSKSQLYNLYVKSSTSLSKPVASRKLFSDILIEQNIGLFQPKKDACDTCCSHKAGNLSEENFQRHIELKNLAREEKSNDKELAKSESIHTITADLQAVKLCPFLTASALYFKTKLAVHNFTVYNLGTNQVTCYWFDETACDLKATTYASFFVDYVTRLLEEDSKDVVIWTDGCTAQNRNSVVSNALLRLAMEKNVTITQKYLEKGHTQMEVDSVHSVIERRLKNAEIYLPSQYVSLTKEARKKPFPYQVIQPDHTFFRDYSVREYQVYDSIRPGRSAGDECVVDLRVLKYNPNGSIEYKNHFGHEFSALPRRPRNISALVNEVPPLYSSRLPILDTKYEHLQQLKSVIPADCHQFYDNLPFKKK